MGTGNIPQPTNPTQAPIMNRMSLLAQAAAVAYGISAESMQAQLDEWRATAACDSEGWPMRMGIVFDPRVAPIYARMRAERTMWITLSNSD